MKKKLIAIAVAGAFIAPVAMADTGNVTIYGQANVSYESIRNDNGKTALGVTVNGVTNNQISSDASRIGFKGSEDLGGGTSAVWQIEQGVAFDTGAWATANRNTYAGLKNESMGEIRLGNHDTPYKMATRNLDMFIDTIADNRSLMGAVGATVGQRAAFAAATSTLTIASALAGGMPSALGSFDGRQPNSIVYLSPSMGGFTVNLGHSSVTESASAANTHKSSIWGAAAAYNVAPFYGTLAYERHTLDGLIAGNTDVWEYAYKLGFGYSVDQFAVNLIYERTHDNFGKKYGYPQEDIFGHHAYYIAGKYNISGSDAVKAAYTKVNDLNLGGIGVNDTGAKQWSLGYDHAMSKRTTVYALYTRLNNNQHASYALMNSGATTAGVASNGFDSSPSAFALGMKHTF